MKPSLRFTSSAERDLESIPDFIAEDNPRRARQFVVGLTERCARICDFPEAAPLRPEIADDIRLIVHSRYLILYANRNGAVVVERIVHGARYLPDLL